MTRSLSDAEIRAMQPRRLGPACAVKGCYTCHTARIAAELLATRRILRRIVKAGRLSPATLKLVLAFVEEKP